jgi:phosphoserine phosphatase
MSKPSAPQPALPHVATLVAAPDVRFSAARAREALATAGVEPEEARWLDAGRALDLLFTAPEARIDGIARRIEGLLTQARIDVIVQPRASRRKRLLVADMDSTIIAQECLDELAGLIGKSEEVARLTAKAMRGEVDFEAALSARVALFAGLAVERMEEIVLRLTPTPGARTLVATMRAHGAHAALVSGGFTPFAEPVATRLGFNAFFANRLEIEDGRLTGRILPPILGGAAKAEILARLCETHGFAAQATLVVGDGANDLEMLATAGLGVAFRAKPVVAARAQARLNHADLTALLHAQGFAREDFVEG